MPAKRYPSWPPYQSYLMPPSPLEWLPQGHLAYFILEVVEALELGDIERAVHRKDPRGERPKAGLLTLGHVSLDGSKIQANASQHKAA